jgi:hypothetical protein
VPKRSQDDAERESLMQSIEESYWAIVDGPQCPNGANMPNMAIAFASISVNVVLFYKVN